MATVKNTHRLKGYILMESMLAMVLVMLCFGIATLIYNNVIASSGNQLRVIARMRLANQAQLAKSENRLLDETIDCSSFRIEQRIQPYQMSSHLIELKLTAIQPNGKELATYHELIYQP
jgi:hypothetical protein